MQVTRVPGSICIQWRLSFINEIQLGMMDRGNYRQWPLQACHLGAMVGRQKLLAHHVSWAQRYEQPNDTHFLILRFNAIEHYGGWLAANVS
jgi:hypothetical protein